MIVLGVTIAAIMRSFSTSLASIGKCEAATTAVFLAQQLVEQYEVELPEESSIEGDFGEEYPYYYYIVNFEEIEVKYKDVALESLIEDFEKPVEIRMDIYYDDGRMKRFRAIHIETYITGVEKFTHKSKMLNKLYF